MALLADPPIGYDPAAVEAAEALVRAYCGWHIAPSETHTVVLDGKGGSTLFLPSLHVTAITSITVDGVLLAATAYEWSQTGQVNRRYGAWPRKLRSISVVFTHGYPVCPPEVRDFIEQSAKASAGSAPLTQAQVGQVAVTYSAPTPARSVLDPYRRFGVA